MPKFNVVSIRSGEVRAVYDVSLEKQPHFLIYRDGEWVWGGIPVV